IIFQWVPDTARVRDKMLYSASKASLTKELGDSKFSDSLFGTTLNEISLEGYRKHLEHKSAKAPLTEREKELEASKTDIGTTTRKAHMIGSGITFPLTNEAVNKIDEFSNGGLQLVVLKIDIESESIDVEVAVGSVALSEVSTSVEKSSPRF
ncbi:hypothetical protein HK096_010714, partial [Nowakowskiella sp. JEL0078]